MFDVFSQALLPFARTSGLEFIRGAVRALVTPLGAHCAFIAELTEGSRVQPLAAYCPDGYVDIGERVAPDELDVVQARARRFCASAADASWHRIDADDCAALCVLVSGSIVEPMHTAVELLAARASAEIARMRITQRKALEQRLVLAERTASMATLAAGVAHEINNPLAYVKGNVEHVLDELRSHSPSAIEPDLLAALEEAREGADRVRRIVHELRLFSRPQDAERGISDIERVIESVLAITKNDILARARLEKVFRHPPAVEVHESRIGQVVVNLLGNAIQSMPTGAPEQNELRIETGVDDAGSVVMTIVDTGAGISPDVIGRIFDPFFTTKAVGEGTGLGLSIAHSIVSAAGGEIAVDSAPGIGTTFRVTLPASDRDAPSVRALSTTPPTPPRRRV